MHSFSPQSELALGTCHEMLQRLFRIVIQSRDCRVLTGFRDKDAQETAFALGNTKLHWPDGKHNQNPSRAVDVAPWPLDWTDRERFVLFAGFVLGVASQLEIPIRWGGDWNQNGRTRDETLSDLVHFELIG